MLDSLSIILGMACFPSNKLSDVRMSLKGSRGVSFKEEGVPFFTLMAVNAPLVHFSSPRFTRESMIGLALLEKA
jgi:hypothetical protein